MYSVRLKAFVEKNKPVEKKISTEELFILAVKAGLEVFRPGDNMDETRESLKSGEILIVSWGGESNEYIYRDGLFGRKNTNKKRRYFWSVTFSEESFVKWSTNVRGGVVVFTPYIYGKGGQSWGQTANPRNLLLEAAALQSIEVKLPEAAVELPRAPWDTSYAYDWGSGMIEDTLVCFKSEAPAHVLPFIDQLRKLIE